MVKMQYLLEVPYIKNTGANIHLMNLTSSRIVKLINDILIKSMIIRLEEAHMNYEIIVN